MSFNLETVLTLYCTFPQFLLAMAPKHQLGSGTVTIYRPSAMRTIGYKRGQMGAGFFTSLAPKLKVIGKKFGSHALKAGLEFINDVVIEKKSPKQAVKSIAMNRLNNAFGQPNKKPIKKAGKRKNNSSTAARQGSSKKKTKKKNPFAI